MSEPRSENVLPGDPGWSLACAEAWHNTWHVVPFDTCPHHRCQHARGEIPVVTRPLAVGDRIAGRPCVVTVERLVGASTAYGHCETCNDRHIIDRSLYEAGNGPWQAAHPGSNAQVQS